MVLFLVELFLTYVNFKGLKSVKNSLNHNWLFCNILSFQYFQYILPENDHAGFFFFLWVRYTDMMFPHQSCYTQSGCESLSYELSPEVMYVTLRISISLCPHLFILVTWLCVLLQEINQLFHPNKDRVISLHRGCKFTVISTRFAVDFPL